MSNQKRCNLYFNIDIREEKELWEWLNSKQKSRYLKRLIEEDMNKANTPIQPQVIYIQQPPNQQNYIQPQPLVSELPKEDTKQEDLKIINKNLDDLDLDL